MKNAKLWFKWTALVWLNAVIGILFSDILTSNDPLFIMGVILGVCTFIPIYVFIDNYAIKTNNKILQKSLLISVFIRAVTQFIFIIDIIAGMIAYSVLGLGFWTKTESYPSGFFDGLFLTIITGGILSVFVSVLTGIVMFFINVFDKKKIEQNKQT